MKASEAVEKLQDMIKKHGDQEMYLPYMDDEYRFVDLRIVFKDINREHASGENFVSGFFLNGWVKNESDY